MSILLPACNPHATYAIPTNIRCSEHAVLGRFIRPTASTVSLGSWVLWLLLRGGVFLLFFYYLAQGFEHPEGKADYTVVLTPTLEVESLIVVVDERFGEKPLVVVKSLGPLRDGFVLYPACLLAHLPWTPPHPLGHLLGPAR